MVTTKSIDAYLESIGLPKAQGYTLTCSEDDPMDLMISRWDLEVNQPTAGELSSFYASYVAEDNMKRLRTERNRRLASTDWWASSDLTMTAEQIAYRQALRDITENYTSLDDVVWPVNPEEQS